MSEYRGSRRNPRGLTNRSVVGTTSWTPYELFSIHIPLALVPSRAISPGAKLLYGRLALFRGKRKDGFCTPGLSVLTREMGVSEDTVERWLRELVAERLIEQRLRGRYPAEYIFLPHPIFDSAALRSLHSKEDSAESRNQLGSASARGSTSLRKSAPLGSANGVDNTAQTIDSSGNYPHENIHHQNILENAQQSYRGFHTDDEGKRLSAGICNDRRF
jgi:Helix-turn-helix domain